MESNAFKLVNALFYIFVSFFFSCHVMAIEEPNFKILLTKVSWKFVAMMNTWLPRLLLRGLLILQVEKVFVGLQDIFLAKIKTQVVRVRKSR